MKTFGQENTGEYWGPSNMRDGETDTSGYTQHWAGALHRKVTAIWLQTTITTTLDSNLAFITRTSLVVTLVERTCGGLGNVNVLKVPEDAHPRRTVIVGKHCPQTMPALTLLELEHDAKVRLIPGRLLRAPSIKRLVTHRNRGASVYGQVYISLAATLWKNPVRLGVHLQDFAETWELRIVPVDSDLVRRFIREVEGDAGVVRRPAYLDQRFPDQRDRVDLIWGRIKTGGFGVGGWLATTKKGRGGCHGRRRRTRGG